MTLIGKTKMISTTIKEHINKFHILKYKRYKTFVQNSFCTNKYK